jgi:hypothetical protein
MGQVLRQDKIGQLTHSAGNIIMAASVASPAYLTIGGRQYTVTSNLSVALPSMTANTRYQVFAVQSGGVVSLVISQNENSVGPAGFLSWKLVGSLMANNASPVVFGSFINIKGSPTTQYFTDSNWSIGAVTTAPTPSTPGFFRSMARDGEFLNIQMEFWCAAGGGAGSGIYLIPMPTNLGTNSASQSLHPAGFPGVGGRFSSVGSGYMLHNALSSGSKFSVAPAVNSNNLQFYVVSVDGTAPGAIRGVYSNTFYSLNVATSWAFTARIPIQGWTNTPIEDL